MSNEPKSGRGRVYTHEEKVQAVALAAQLGTSAAARALGAPSSTVDNWRTRGIGGPTITAPTEVTPVEVPAPTPVMAPAAGPIVEAAAGAPRPYARPRVAKVYTPSQVAQALERVAAIGVRPAAAEPGISRNALRDWERKVAKAAMGEGTSPASGPDPKTIEERRDASILAEWRKQQGLGPSQIRNQLRRAGIKVSHPTDFTQSNPKAPYR